MAGRHYVWLYTGVWHLRAVFFMIGPAYLGYLPRSVLRPSWVRRRLV